MKKSLVLVVLVLLIGVTAGAQGYTYHPSNTPTAGGSNGWPFTSSKTEWRFSYILDASTLPNAPIKITEIAWAFSSTTTKVAKQLQIRMGHTTHKNYGTSGTTLFDDILGPCATIVYDGPYKLATTANVWTDLGLQRTFGYDGKSNLVIEVRYYQTSGSASVRSDASLPRAYTHSGYSANAYNDPKWYTPIPGEFMGPKTRLTYVKDNIVLTDTTQSIGSTAAVNYVNGTGGHTVQLAASLGQNPLNLGACTIYLNTDGVFFYSVSTGVPIFNAYAQILPGTGPQSTFGKFALPKIPALVGLCVYHSGITHLRGTIIGCANTDGTKIVP